MICGGTGFIGNALSKRLLDSGYEVTIVSRKPTGDQVGWDRLIDALQGSTAVINLSGRSIVCKFSPANRKAILDSRIDSTRQIAKALAECSSPPATWINASAVGYYGTRGDELLTELSLPGTGFMPDVCVPWEAACLESKTQPQKTVLRLGLVFSSQGGVLKTLMTLTKFFLGGQAANGKQWVAWITLSDLTKMIQWTIEHNAPPVINACSPNPVTNADMMVWLRRECHRPWSPPIPKFALDLVGKTIGPDSSLVLNSTRVIPQNAELLEFDFPMLDNVRLSEI